jgi:hypothetical protein
VNQTQVLKVSILQLIVCTHSSAQIVKVLISIARFVNFVDGHLPREIALLVECASLQKGNSLFVC